MKPHRLLLLPLAVVATFAHAGSTDVAVADAYVRQPPPAARTGAAFFTLKNAGKTEVRLVAAENPASNITELHNHINEGGVMKMRQVKDIPVPAGGQAKLEPGGLHVMLIDLKQPLKAGDTVPLTLRFDDGGKQLVNVPVRAGDGAPPMDHKHH